jgi:PPM family protein phosphatase
MAGSTGVVRWGAASDAGRVRPGNEDDFVADGEVFGVADGMGGHLAGEVASKMAAERLRDRLAGGADHPDVVVAAVMEANAAIFAAAHANLEQRGMGTTLTALSLLHADGDPRVVVANVGDSRTYVLRHGRLRRVTTDHSYVQELVATGHITETEARNHPRRNIVTRALGIEPIVRVDTMVLPRVRGDRYVLCSDGLVDEVDDDVIAAIVIADEDPQAAADGLVSAANEAGGRDNITVVVVDILDGLDPPAPEDDLDLELGWADSAPGGSQLIEADEPDDTPPPAAAPVRTFEHRDAPPPAVPATPPPAKRKRFGIGTVLFVAALAIIATVTGVLVAQVVDRGEVVDIVPPSTTSTTSTTSPATSTTVADTTAPSGPTDVTLAGP